jgi:hypothetical protein
MAEQIPFDHYTSSPSLSYGVIHHQLPEFLINHKDFRRKAESTRFYSISLLSTIGLRVLPLPHRKFVGVANACR